MSINRIGFGAPGLGTPVAGTPTPGTLPFPQPTLATLLGTGGNPQPGSPNAVSLPSGGIFVLPAGQYIVGLGRQTVLQWYDPLSQMWRGFSAPQNNVIVGSSDGSNFRLLNASGVAVGGLITNAGSGGTNGIGATATGTTVSFGAAPTNGVAATGYVVVGGAINTTITITTAGAGYRLPPTIVIDPPPAGGIQATAQVTTLSAAGAITAVTVLNAGAGYTVVPQARVIPAFGETPTTQGVLTVNATLAGSGTLTGIVMQNAGSLYLGTAIPTISFANTTGALAGGVAATAIMSFCLQSVTITNAGAVYQTATFHPWVSSLGSVQNVAAGANTTGILNEFLGGRPARGTANSGAGTTIAAVSIEDQGFGFQKVPSIGIATAGTTVPTTIALLTAVVGSQTDTSLVQPLP